uniref:Uncharacterized protein n=1 Tax=Octopus bimaculoides TaxID=37653 RepID=A0A0L8IAQ2_OCTBM
MNCLQSILTSPCWGTGYFFNTDLRTRSHRHAINEQKKYFSLLYSYCLLTIYY